MIKGDDDWRDEDLSSHAGQLLAGDRLHRAPFTVVEGVVESVECTLRALHELRNVPARVDFGQRYGQLKDRVRPLQKAHVWMQGITDRCESIPLLLCRAAEAA